MLDAARPIREWRMSLGGVVKGWWRRGLVARRVGWRATYSTAGMTDEQEGRAVTEAVRRLSDLGDSSARLNGPSCMSGSNELRLSDHSETSESSDKPTAGQQAIAWRSVALSGSSRKDPINPTTTIR